MLLAVWAMQLLTALVPANLMAGMPYLQNLGLNVRVLTFTTGVALLATALFAVDADPASVAVAHAERVDGRQPRYCG